jgi:uncharacterized protein (TIGR03435 family)
MIHSIASKLDLGRKILLATVGAATLAGPIVFGLFHATPSRAQQAQNSAPPAGFETVMVRPNKTGEAMPPFHIVSEPPGKGMGFKNGSEGFLATNAPLRALIRFAYGVQDSQISGGPDWMDSERYDVVTKYTKPMTGLSDYQEVKLLVQALLADRFKLVVHHEIKELPAYVLVVGPNGSKLNEVQVRPDSNQQFSSRVINHQLINRQTDMSALVSALSYRTGRPVIDETKLKGEYDFTLDWPLPQSPDAQAALVAALRDQLGLELREQPALVDTIVVDHAERVTGDQQ